jgi:hypothetical protein
MNEHFAKQVLQDVRTSLKPSEGDSDRVMKKIMASVAAASVVTAAAATAAETSKVKALVSALTKGTSVVKLGVGAASVCGAVALSVWFMQRPAEPPKVANKPSVSHSIVLGRLPSIVESAKRVSKTTADGLVGMENAAALQPATADATLVEYIKAAHVVRASTTSQDTKERERTALNDDPVLREIAVVKSASSALKSGQPQETLRILEAFEKTSRKGVMDEERSGLRVAALCALGKKQKAFAAAHSFFKQYPDSVMALSIKDKCRDLE